MISMPHESPFGAAKGIWQLAVKHREQVSASLTDLNAVMNKHGQESVAGREARSLVSEMEPIFDVFVAAEADAERALLEQPAHCLDDLKTKIGAMSSREMVGSIEFETDMWRVFSADIERLVFAPAGIAS